MYTLTVLQVVPAVSFRLRAERVVTGDTLGRGRRAPRKRRI